MTPWLASLFSFGSILAWGASTDRVWVSLGMGLALMAAALSPFKILSDNKAQARASDFTLAIIAVAGFLSYLRRESLETNLAVHLLTLCPFLLYPKLFFNAIQLEGPSAAGPASRDGTAIARAWLDTHLAFSRKHLDKKKPLTFESIYFYLALFIACFSLPWRAGVPALVVGVLGFALAQGNLAQTKKRRAKAFGLTLLALALSLSGAWLGSMAIERVQSIADDYLNHIWSRRSDVSSANSTDTSIGRRGRIDNGNRLLARIDWTPPQRYLRNGVFSYTSNGTTWFAASPHAAASDRSVFPADGNAFSLPRSAEPPLRQSALFQAKISTTLARERSALALPIGSAEIFGLPVSKLELNSMGVPTTSGSPGFVKFGVTFDPAFDAQPPPDENDLEVPLALQNAIDAFIAEAGVQSLAPTQAAAAIAAYFKQHWTYTLNLEGADGAPRSLTRFLRRDRQGHCEYFAAATTLALRRLGFPSRYATGFLVDEFDAREKLFWVRARDAHAWSSFWDGSQWRLVDSTPGGSEKPLGWATSGEDWLVRLQYLMEEFDSEALVAPLQSPYLWAVAFFVLGYLAYRLKIRRRSKSRVSDTLETDLLCSKIEALTGEERASRETSCDFWRRCADRFESPLPFIALARQREEALFRPLPDQARALAQCEALAKTLRRNMPNQAHSR